MEKDPSYFDEQLHRKKLADFRLGLDDQLSELERGRINRESKQALFTYMVAEIYDLYEWLVTQTVMGQMMDAKSRQVHKHLCLQITALELSLAHKEGEFDQQSKQNKTLLGLLLDLKPEQLKKEGTPS
ncbi:hypothetical protein [Hymenobacter sp. UYCo722]|uniref:hypothetical protein n=1 Tax=Hymenobacter sp. UYCo722 TaxID=3156335 RepID=UPI0033931A97